MAVEQNAQFPLLLDDNILYCEEEKWAEFEDQNSEVTSSPVFPLLLLDQEDDEELESLFIKETETCLKSDSIVGKMCCHSSSRKEAVEWILKVSAFHGFSALTAILAVNYLDRFLLSLSCVKDNKPWMMQLVAVTCLSLAAKVEETNAPLLLDLQLEGTKYVFEAKAIQKMELLVLSSLKWKMNPVTPLSFLDRIIRRVGMKNVMIHWEFLRSCENLLLSVISDPRIVRYLPSVLATATMIHVLHKVHPSNYSIDHENQLLGVLKSCKNQEAVDDCYELISDVISDSHNKNSLQKRRFCQVSSSPTGVMEKYFNSDSSNDSWELSSHISSSSHKKTKRVQEQHMKLPSLKHFSIFL